MTMGLHGEDEPAGDTAGTPRRAGRYVLGRVLGQGAMGVVRASHDPALDREVAVKLIARGLPEALRDTAEPDPTRSQRIPTDPSRPVPSGASLDDARLLAEARSLAAVAHAHIVEVFDVGVCEAGVFIAMELVDGVSLRAWNEKHRPDWRVAVELHLQAAEALAAAHRVGIVHGDFKPDNVLVREHGSSVSMERSGSIAIGPQLKVVDFGLARAMGLAEAPPTEGEGHEVTGGSALVFGTPAYLAPECWGDPRREASADQFAFFVALCESITGHRPYARVDSLAALFVLLGSGPALGELQRRVPAALRKVVARGLDPDPARRFASMDEVITQLRALLAGERSDRSRRSMAVAAMVAIVPTVLFGVGVWNNARMRSDAALKLCTEQAETIDAQWNDESRARIEAAFVAASPRAGADAFARVRPWVDDYASTWRSLRGQSCMRSVGSPPGPMESARTACFAEREASLSALLEVLALADAQTVREAVRSAADLPRVAACDDEAWLAHHAALPDEPALRERVTAAQRSLARADQLLDGRRIEPARVLIDDAEQVGTELSWPSLVARAQALRGRALVMQGKYDEGETELEAAYFHASETDDETTAAIAAELASLVGTKLARFDDGLAWVRHAETALASMGGPEIETHARLGIAQAAILLRSGQIDKAIAPAERARQIRERIFGGEHPSVAAASLTLGSIYGQLDRTTEAVAELERAREIFEHTLGEDHPQLAGVYHNLGMAEIQQRNPEAARAWFMKALELRRRWLAPDHPDLATSLAGLGYAELALDRPEAAQRAFEQSLAIRQAKLGPNHPAVGETLENLGHLAGKRGDCGEAVRRLGRAVELLQSDRPRHLKAVLGLADAHLACNARTEALARYEEARTLAEADATAFALELARANAGVTASSTAR